MKQMLLSSLSVFALLVAGSTAVSAQDAAGPLKIGVLATLEGTYTALGEDGVRGLKMALAAAGNKAGGREVKLVIQSTDASPDSALRGARKLVEQDAVEIVIGPLSGSEGIAIRDYSKTKPKVTFINGISAAMETTYVEPSENFFRFNTDGAQWSAGLGSYIYNEKGYRNIATVGEDYSFVYTQVFGLVTEFCAAGGKVAERLWVPLGTKDFGSIIAALPVEVDAIYLGLGGGDAVNFLNQYQQAGGEARLIGGSLMVDGTVLSSEGSAKRALIATPSSGPQADSWDDQGWKDYVKAYQDAFPPEERFPSPSLLATGYYNATNAMLQCMATVGGNLSDGQAAFRGCLSKLTLKAPNGTITLDENRQAIGANFISEVVENTDGTLSTKMVKMVENVNQTLGIDPAAFAKIGLPSRDKPACQATY
ncbi:ABC transporter substrate-binding protein [Rhizobium leguminosarum]|nr:ABC transporter substrate-binding protein [Rhizobium leguminosarum]NEJ47451.1 ABC transporter substrate-binding protein [Rhizobium leguminosarum]NEJ54400.1 ABC transporter substrate-binding protein [Rhizobium leguminosarum]NEJ82243.1 ABC transporter substrate-binding protein [Rhizobium leguminosarum]